VEREINALQFNYLQSWWRHNCVTLHVTKVYFMELKMNIGRPYWKTPILVWIITLAFLGRFLYFFELTETGMNTLQRINKTYNITLTVSSHYITFWDDSIADHFLECVRSNPLFATFAESHLMFIFFYFFCTNFLSVFWQTFSQIFDQDFIFKLKSKLNIFNVKK